MPIPPTPTSGLFFLLPSLLALLTFQPFPLTIRYLSWLQTFLHSIFLSALRAFQFLFRACCIPYVRCKSTSVLLFSAFLSVLSLAFLVLAECLLLLSLFFQSTDYMYLESL